ncbi:ABC transporter substrate-binding protein [Streptomyces litchfieldiae]|uniref:Extracellular solute-binding protein n=1 Tax=Streptomyces litchfieldiae TaxID=3075543 RepID=A0ABU2MMY3_9ACTN|nr:extracellular solute-binding protein [Streptomyces sp. DSM 44938]MDT0342971.1 extracellular solute-binding protein [Streptomyces sp. DSM 44938]
MIRRQPPDISRRQLLRMGGGLGAAGLLGGALSGCARTADAEPLTSGSVDLAFWTHDQAYVDFFQVAADNAMAAGTGPFRWTLNDTRTGATDIVTKTIAQAIAGRGTPDVAGLEIGAFPRLLRGDLAAELLQPLNDAVADVRDDLLPSRTAPFTKDDNLYALDSDSPLVVYYYRETEFDRVGLPTDLGTWDELAEAAAAVRRQHDVCLGAVTVGSELGQVVQGFDMLLMQRGGRLFNEDGTIAIESPEAEETLAFLVRGVQEGYVATVSDYFGPSMQAALKSGQLIGQWMATWYKIYGLVPNVPEHEGEWRIRPLPAFPGGGGRTSFTGGTGFAALRGKENTLAGVELIKAAYLTPEEQVRRYLDLGYLPTLRSVFEDPQLLGIEDQYCGGQRMFEVYRDVIDEAPVFYLSADKPILDTVLSGYLLRAYNGDLSPREALARAAEDFRGQTRSSRS